MKRRPVEISRHVGGFSHRPLTNVKARERRKARQKQPSGDECYYDKTEENTVYAHTDYSSFADK
jgi:hypothetical protein